LWPTGNARNFNQWVQHTRPIFGPTLSWSSLTPLGGGAHPSPGRGMAEEPILGQTWAGRHADVGLGGSGKSRGRRPWRCSAAKGIIGPMLGLTSSATTYVSDRPWRWRTEDLLLLAMVRPEARSELTCQVTYFRLPIALLSLTQVFFWLRRLLPHPPPPALCPAASLPAISRLLAHRPPRRTLLHRPSARSPAAGRPPPPCPVSLLPPVPC
jgi:hypothetical protein